jgi:Fanconi anemia group M protein
MYKDTLLNLIPRGYQVAIYETCLQSNCLVILPTGLGKSLIFLMSSIERLKKYPNSKVVILAPTRPLAEQHLEYFKKNMKKNFAKLELFTGKIKAEDRKKIWKTANIIFSTPQCIENDLKHKLYDLKDCSLLVEDEAHHCLKKYSYVFVAEKYKEQALNQRVMGLTASAGIKKSTIEQIMNSLNIQKIEIRTRESDDVKEYLQELDTNKIYVELPPRFREIENLFKAIMEPKIVELRAMGLLLGPTNKRVILDELKKVSAMIRKEPNIGHLYRAMSVLGLLIRCNHSIELLQAQSIHTLNDFIDETYKGTTKGMQNLVKIPEFIKATEIIKDMLSKNEEHPKMQKILELIQEQQKINPEFKALCFSTFRTTTGALAAMLNRNGISAAQLVGQGKKTTTFGDSGLKQSEQQSTIRDFKSGKIKVLCPTSIGEEGLDLPEINAVIFYEPVPSAIRAIQRRGRTARLMKGSLYTFITRDSIDEIYLNSSAKKEEKMHKSLETIGHELNNTTPFTKFEKDSQIDSSKWEEVGR